MATRATKSIIVKAPVSQVYRLWSEFERFPQFMDGIESVTRTGPDMSHWVAKGPMGKTLEWDARTTRMEEHKRIAWNSTGGDVETTGQVTFTELPQGETEVGCTLQYDMGNPVSEGLGNLFSDLDGWLERDMRRFKQYCESGVGAANQAGIGR